MYVCVCLYVGVLFRLSFSPGCLDELLCNVICACACRFMGFSSGICMKSVPFSTLTFILLILTPGVQLRIVYGHSRSVLSMEIGAFDALFVCIYAM